MCACAVAILVISLLDPFYYLLRGCRPVGFVIRIPAWYTDLYPQNSLISAHHFLSFQATFQDYSDILMFAKIATPFREDYQSVCLFPVHH